MPSGTPLSPVNFVNKSDNMGGLATTNKFSIQITPPTNFSTSFQPEMWSFLCHKADLPAAAMQTTEDRIYGIETLKPYGITYEPATLSVYNTNDFYPRSFWEDCLDFIQPFKTRNMNYYDHFTGEAKIYHYTDWSEDPSPDNANYFAHLREIWPLSMSEIELSWEGDELMTFDVQLQYKYWTRKKTDRGTWAGKDSDEALKESGRMKGQSGR